MDKVIVVTGAFGALGGGLAAFARAKGAKVAAIDYAPAPAGYSADFVQGGVDLSKAADAKAAIDAAAAKLGRLDGLANIAGGFAMEKIEGGGLEPWDRLFALNLKTCLNSCAAAIPHLKASGAGAIVNVGAIGALHAGQGMGAYAASKSGVHRLTESLAAELKGQVTVNAVMPSTIDTPANRRDMPKADFSKWVTAEELASVILFLLSPEARAVTGALIPVAGRV
ncbi:MAG: SDR family NAD(P)-dependent oxidoreductase [Hyphomonadaceae bacterium]|nr:SDR family NAD(P)-dependent oxidoreductase [Hyphomonadaceae bacterium]